MQRLILAVALAAATLATAPAVRADYDPKLEAEEKAQRDAAKRAQQERDRQAAKMQAEYQAKADAEAMARKRKELGAAANGKSDAEVNKMYDAKVKANQQEAAKNMAAARKAMDDPSANAQMKALTGKSMQEIQSMTPEQQEAFMKEMQKKMGQ